MHINSSIHKRDAVRPSATLACMYQTTWYHPAHAVTRLIFMSEDTDTEAAVTDINAPTNATINPSTSVMKAYQMVYPECNMTNRQHHTHS